MKEIEHLDEFYQRKFNRIPEGIHQENGHFNVFRLMPHNGDKTKPSPYKRRDFYKITLMIGNSTIHYADKVIDIQKQALVFSNPLIPYRWEHTEGINTGCFCVFNQRFFHQYGNLDQYEVFQANGTHVFDLSDQQVEKAAELFERMFEEINSDYIHKYDVIRTVVFELLHFAMKTQPAMNFSKQLRNANSRISVLFLELLERQFPIDENHPVISLRSASDFANQLNIHVNHLNRALRETTQKTTTQIITERILEEAKILLKQSVWSISEVAGALGFTEVTHFNNFFKKHLQISPLKYRNV
ncbi:MAG TPA: AraC family transcriptional regulator [Bacteroidales bacterium]|nr:MAG: transcriptional regulator [Bacteroidetes bacterium GWE2_42_24]OFY30687.1 MAG: transcriptional regulator [Bacteroidetes bacterium GWF2_43_11]HAQ65369.1 AraC family transcriptional regulator [Bacteroidales bacterium]HBZ65682.1 AraC family transcriptional regulator [Bacteroidales bacterium]